MQLRDGDKLYLTAGTIAALVETELTRGEDGHEMIDSMRPIKIVPAADEVLAGLTFTVLARE